MIAVKPAGTVAVIEAPTATLTEGPLAPCPTCGTDRSLVLIGTCPHDPPFPLRWMRFLMGSYATEIYLCTACADVVSLNTVR